MQRVKSRTLTYIVYNIPSLSIFSMETGLLNNCESIYIIHGTNDKQCQSVFRELKT